MTNITTGHFMIKHARTSCNHMKKCNQIHGWTYDKPTAITHDSNLCLSMCLSTSQTRAWPRLQHMTDHKVCVLTCNDSNHVGKHDLTHVNPKYDGTYEHKPNDTRQDFKAKDSTCLSMSQLSEPFVRTKNMTPSRDRTRDNSNVYRSRSRTYLLLVHV